ncbi:hypothetical protein OT109_06630 [Phycisphaeraceae bacterium D3-23]
MKPFATCFAVLLCTMLCLGCASRQSQVVDAGQADVPAHRLTVVIAMSAVPLGITGHTGIAIDEEYWDFGPNRVSSKQRLQGLGSPAGPWWDDPEQDGHADYTLAQVLDSLPERVHPDGSVIAIFTADITADEAQALRAYWSRTYATMARDDIRYELTHRQCSSVGCHSLGGVAGLPGFMNITADPTDLPPQLRVMTPTLLAAYLRLYLRHTAGPDAGRRAGADWLQLRSGRLVPYDPPFAALLGIRGEALAQRYHSDEIE